MRKRGDSATPKEKEEGALNGLGKFYDAFRNYSLFTRYLVYLFPVGIALAVPIVLGATVFPRARIGGTRMVWFFTWMEIRE